MSTQKLNPGTGLLLLVILSVAALRVATNFSPRLEPLATFTPIGAMALFGGAYFPGFARPFAFPMLTLFAGDIFLSFTVYASYRSGLLYTGWFWTYLAFAGMVLAGKLILQPLTIKRMFISVIAVTLIHWLVSDVGGCLREAGLSASLIVYFQRLVAAIPFELRFLAGTVLYGGIMFGAVESRLLRLRRIPRTQTTKEHRPSIL
ncbi:MAG TPA: DUF6580 family putative transport protein [Puia sp.]|nr:DUF6580 family putative transport protein [Puia sp.]